MQPWLGRVGVLPHFSHVASAGVISGSVGTGFLKGRQWGKLGLLTRPPLRPSVMDGGEHSFLLSCGTEDLAPHSVLLAWMMVGTPSISCIPSRISILLGCSFP